VTTLADGGPGSLRATVAGAASGAVIGFAPSLAGKTIALSTGPITLATTPITIAGTCPAITITWSAPAAGQHMIAIGANVNATLSGLTLTSTNAAAIGVGGGASALIDNVTITGSTAAGCAAIDGAQAPAHIALSSSVVSANTSTGDGIVCNTGQLNVVTTSITGNTTGGFGAVFNSGTGATNFSESVVAQNKAQNGGASATTGGTFAATNSTFYANSASGSGGAFYVSAAGAAALDYVTVASNAAPDAQAVAAAAQSLTLHNTLLTNAATPGESDTAAALDSLGYNFVTAPGTSTGFVATDILKAGVPLYPFGNYGGATNSLPPSLGAAVIDAADPGADECPSVDQRGVKRPQGSRCDIGAIEYRFSDPP
jgi:hypothetical protein